MLLIVGGLIGGLTLGFALGGVALLSVQLEPARVGLLWGTCGLAAFAAIFGGSSRWIPQALRQVGTSTLIERGPARAAFAWGRELGVGFHTFVVTPAFYAVVGLCMATDPVTSVLVGATYGTTRGAVIAVFALVVRRRASCATRRSEPGLGLERRFRVPLAAACLLAAVMATR
jgi:hypothetical protein